MFTHTPRFGLAVWFLYLLSSLLAGLSAIVIVFWALFDFLINVRRGESIAYVVTSNFGLWFLIAASGIAISLMNLKAEPLFKSGSLARKELLSSCNRKTTFQNVGIYQIQFAAPLAFNARIGKDQAIIVSDTCFRDLSASELQAICWHELAHIKGHHNLLKAIAKFVALFSPLLSASKLFLSETERLTEIVADNQALKHVPPRDLISARKKFLE